MEPTEAESQPSDDPERLLVKQLAWELDPLQALNYWATDLSHLGPDERTPILHQWESSHLPRRHVE